MNYIWNVVHDCDDDNGNPTCWVSQLNSEQYGKYIWITLQADGLFYVEHKDFESFKALVACKSLKSAKKWVTHLKNKEGL